MKLAMLAPIAWRTPPKHYGPWESIASLLTEGLVARGVDVTLFATLDSVTAAALDGVCPHGYAEDAQLDGRVWEALHVSHALARSGEFELVHNHLDWLPLAFGEHARAPMVTTIHGFSGAGILPAYTRSRSAFVAISDSDRYAGLDYAATIHHGIDLGLLMLTTYAGLMLAALIAALAVASARGRARLLTPYPWVAVFIAVLVASPHLIWLYEAGAAPLAGLASVPAPSDILVDWLVAVAGLLTNHAGLLVLVVVAGALFTGPRIEVPTVEREPVARFGKIFVTFFAVAPVLIATLVIALGGESALATGAGPFMVLSGLLVMLFAGDVIRMHRQSVVGWIWLALLAGPALTTVAAIVVLPWTIGVELKISEPGPAMASFFTESFNRRTGKPLAIVVGGARLGGLIALASPDRPHLFIDAVPERAPWIHEGEVGEKGAVVVWPLTDPTGQPPAAIRSRFPDLVPEVPHAFERTIQGRLPLLRIGWAVIRPASVPPDASK